MMFFGNAGKGEVVSEHFSLLPCDLRNLKDMDAAFAKAGLDAKWETHLLWYFLDDSHYHCTNNPYITLLSLYIFNQKMKFYHLRWNLLSLIKDKDLVYFGTYSILVAYVFRSSCKYCSIYHVHVWPCRLPTLIFAECVLIYLDPAVSRHVVKWCADKFDSAALIIYEQVRSYFCI